MNYGDRALLFDLEHTSNRKLIMPACDDGGTKLNCVTETLLACFRSRPKREDDQYGKIGKGGCDICNEAISRMHIGPITAFKEQHRSVLMVTERSPALLGLLT